jgi:hypothetical protein
MACLQPAQILQRVPAAEGENGEKAPGSQASCETEDTFASNKKSDSQAERERQQCATRHTREINWWKRPVSVPMSTI